MAGEKESIDEGILDTLKSKMKGIITRVIRGVKNFVMRGVNSLMKFLGVTPEISVNTRIYFK